MNTDEMTFADRVRFAARVMGELDDDAGSYDRARNAAELKDIAKQMEREQAALNEQVGELGRALMALYDSYASAGTPHLILARVLVENGWRKGESA